VSSSGDGSGSVSGTGVGSTSGTGSRGVNFNAFDMFDRCVTVWGTHDAGCVY